MNLTKRELKVQLELLDRHPEAVESHEERIESYLKVRERVGPIPIESHEERIESCSKCGKLVKFYRGL